MVHDIDAIYDHGVLRPVEPLVLPEGERVRVRVEEDNTSEQPEVKPDTIPSLFERLKDVVGSIDDLPEDSSTNLDHYLYGHPKR